MTTVDESGVPTSLGGLLNRARTALEKGPSPYSDHVNFLPPVALLMNDAEERDIKRWHSQEGNYPSAGIFHSCDEKHACNNIMELRSKVYPIVISGSHKVSMDKDYHLALSEQVDKHNSQDGDFCQGNMSNFGEMDINENVDCGYSEYVSGGDDGMPPLEIIEIKGELFKIPSRIACSRCGGTMKLTVRPVPYKNKVNERHYYRCLLRGCQTFRSVSKLVHREIPKPRGSRSSKKQLNELSDSSLVASHEEQSKSNITPKNEDADGPQPRTRTEEDAYFGLMGTLLYIPFVMTQEEVVKVQQAAFDIASATSNLSDGSIMSTPCTFTSSEVNRKMQSPHGQMEIRSMFLSNTYHAHDQPCFATAPNSLSSLALPSMHSPLSMTDVVEDSFSWSPHVSHSLSKQSTV